MPCLTLHVTPQGELAQTVASNSQKLKTGGHPDASLLEEEIQQQPHTKGSSRRARHKFAVDGIINFSPGASWEESFSAVVLEGEA